jgi:hypothetical protein
MKNTKHKAAHEEASFGGDRKRTRAITVESPNIPGTVKEMAERQNDTRAAGPRVLLPPQKARNFRRR